MGIEIKAKIKGKKKQKEKRNRKNERNFGNSSGDESTRIVKSKFQREKRTRIVFQYKNG